MNSDLKAERLASIELDEMDLHVLKMFAFSEVSFNWCHDESEV